MKDGYGFLIEIAKKIVAEILDNGFSKETLMRSLKSVLVDFTSELLLLLLEMLMRKLLTPILKDLSTKYSERMARRQLKKKPTQKVIKQIKANTFKQICGEMDKNPLFKCFDYLYGRYCNMKEISFYSVKDHGKDNAELHLKKIYEWLHVLKDQESKGSVFTFATDVLNSPNFMKWMYLYGRSLK